MVEARKEDGFRGVWGGPRWAPWCCALALLLAGCAGTRARRFEYQRPHMGTPFRLVLYASDGVRADAAAEAAFARIAELDSILNDRDPASELSRLSRSSRGGAPTEPISLSNELWTVLERASELGARTDGAFDVTVGPYVRLWRRAGRQEELPSPERLRQASRAVGGQRLRLDPARRSARLLAADMHLDLGGIAKGYALDEALRVLRRLGVRSALVDGGGDVAVGEAPPGLPGWRIAIWDPPGETPAAAIELSHAAIATSGDSARSVEIDGIRYSHIVDPRTGLGLTGGISATAIAPRGMDADALASALCVLGPGRGIELIDATPGAEARVLALAGERLRVSQSRGFASRMVDSSPRPDPQPEGPQDDRPTDPP